MPLADEVYARVFVNNPEGALVLAEMEKRFVRRVVTEGGIDAVIKTYYHQGQRDVIEWIANRINRANGAITMEQPTDDE